MLQQRSSSVHLNSLHDGVNCITYKSSTLLTLPHAVFTSLLMTSACNDEEQMRHSTFQKIAKVGVVLPAVLQQ